jgi:hypothetical protein
MAKKPAPEESGSASESGSMSGSESGSMSGSGSSVSESGSASGAASEDDTEASDSKPAKKSGGSKRQSGRTARASGSQRSVGAGGGAPIRPLGSGADLVPVICSECYEEFVFDSKVKSDTLTCPICEHQASRPDDAQLAVIAEKRKQEKTNFSIALGLCLGSLLFFMIWVLALRNPHTNAHEAGAMFYGPGVVALLLFLGCCGMTLGKYEGARHDVYF